jgi:hypothetical protein
MANLYLIPPWFYGYDAILELTFAIVTLVVCVFAFKIYNLSEQRQSKLFGFSFLFISLAYFLQSIVNFIIFTKLSQSINKFVIFSHFNLLNLIGIYGYVFFFMLGLITLTYMTLKIKSIKVYSLLFITLMTALFFTDERLYLFYVLSSILIAYVTWFYLTNYMNNKKLKTFLVLIAFVFLLVATINFTFSINNAQSYVLGHISKFIAYILILISLILIFRKK